MSAEDFPDDMTLAAARDLLAAHLEAGLGEVCPVCSQFSKVYRRKLNERIARVLIAMWHKAGTDWIYLPNIGGSDDTDVPAARSGEHAFAAHWGLIERNSDEGGRGHWRLTEHGAQFVQNRIKIPKYAMIYDGYLLSLDDSETVDIVEVLGTRWDYDEMMRESSDLPPIDPDEV